MTEEMVISWTEMTQCPTCCRDIDEPRVLPCLHAYCLKCIETCRDDVQLTCTACQQQFRVPDGGIEKLIKKDVFVERLVKLKKLREMVSDQNAMCGLCACHEDNSTDEDFAAGRKAIFFCVDCSVSMCQVCLDSHQTLNLPVVHSVIDLEEWHIDVNLQNLTRFPDYVCAQHPGDSQNICCRQCRTAVCQTCHVAKHTSHRYSDLREVAEKMSNNMTRNLQDICVKIDECDEALDKLTEETSVYDEDMTNLEKQITDRAEEMKRVIEERKVALIAQLSAAKERHEQRIQTLRQKLNGHLVRLETFKKYFMGLHAMGTANDVVTASDTLNHTAKELREIDVGKQQIESCLSSFNARFLVESSDYGVENCFGCLEIEWTEALSSKGILKKSLNPERILRPEVSYMTDVTSLGNDVFVSVYGCKNIPIYDLDSLRLHRHLTLPSSGRHSGIAACSLYDCIYVSDEGSDRLYRVAETTDNNDVIISNWSVGRMPKGVSVNTYRHVLVACHRANVIQEYTTQGNLVREISLSPHVRVIRMSADPPAGSRYSTVDLVGKVVQKWKFKREDQMRAGSKSRVQHVANSLSK